MRIKIVALAALVVSLAVSSFAQSPVCHPPNYGYSGFTNQEEWKYIPGISSRCGNASVPQSPIVLENATDVRGSRLTFLDYHEDRLTLQNSGHDFRVLLPANTQAHVRVPGDSKTYRLTNFHFHAPNEHVLSNPEIKGEVHFVHEAVQGSTTYIVVVTFFLRASGTSSIFDSILNPLPIHLCATRAVTFEWNRLLEHVRLQNSYYTYAGSLTTPPCSGNVKFFIYPEPIDITPDELIQLKTYGNNNRNTHPRNPNNPLRLVDTASH